MELEIHHRNICFAELKTGDQVINNLQDAIDLLGNANYLEASCILIKKENLHPDFFELRSGLAGDILQKFSNYRMRLAIIGDFSSYKSNALKDFIFESNKLGQIMYLPSRDEAFSILT